MINIISSITKGKRGIVTGIVKDNVEWFSHCYQELLKHPKTSSKIMVVGMSYGGANLLKASFEKRFTDNPPKSILSYGTYYSIETALNFFLTGEISYQNKLHKITPHEWGTIVIFYNIHLLLYVATFAN